MLRFVIDKLMLSYLKATVKQLQRNYLFKSCYKVALMAHLDA